MSARMQQSNNIPNLSSLLGAIAVYVGSLLGAIAVVKSLIPPDGLEAINAFFTNIISWAWPSDSVSIHVEELRGWSQNDVFDNVQDYIDDLVSSSKLFPSQSLDICSVQGAAAPRFSLTSGQSLEDFFEGISFKWSYQVRETKDAFRTNERRSYTLKFDKKHGRTLLQRYFDHVDRRGKESAHKKKQKMLHTNNSDGDGPWVSTPFRHPSTMESIAMSKSLKNKIVEDLRRFMAGEEFFNRVGRAWKRGYLLFGPPGTGKSSLIAAIANFTGYDIYDIELTEVKSNYELRQLLMSIKSKSIIVIEDVDCSLQFENRDAAAPKTPDPQKEGDGKPKTPAEGDGKGDDAESIKVKKVTLSGILNFTDGLWSCCDKERIIIFTTNYVDKLDPALLRSGRMDFKIEMSYCSFEGFKVLAKTYLEIEDHELFPKVEELLGKITPAEIAEVLIQNKDDVELALTELIKVLFLLSMSLISFSAASVQKAAKSAGELLSSDLR